MRKPAASDDDRDAGQPRRLTLALAFGFAAGALLARRPAAAMTALVTGVVACLNTTGKSGDSCAEDDEKPPGQDGPPAKKNQTSLPPVFIPEGNAIAKSASPASLEPLPDISTAPASPQTEQVDELLSLSLPDVDAINSTEPAGDATPVIDDRKPDDDGTAPAGSSARREITAATRKRSWLTWLR